MGGFGTSFGLNPDDYSFDTQTTSGYDDPAESWVEKTRRLNQMRQMLAAESTAGPPPDPISIPRVQKQTQSTSLLAQHPESGKWLDLANQLGAVLSNAKKKRYQKKHPGSRVTYTPIPPGQFNARAKAIETEKYNNEYAAAKENADIALSEARINESTMNRYLGRKTAELGQVMPSVSRAMFRDPKAAKAPAVWEQKRDYLDKIAKENPGMFTPEQLTRMQIRNAGGGDSRSPSQIADDQAKAHVKLMEVTQKFKSENPKSAKDIDEADLTEAGRMVAWAIHNDFMGIDEAVKVGEDYVRGKRILRGKTKTPGGLTPPDEPPPPSIALPNFVGDAIRGATPTGAGAPGAPGAPMGGSSRVKAEAANLPSPLRAKLAIYAATIARSPDRREWLRQAIIKETGVDPDLYLEPEH